MEVMKRRILGREPKTEVLVPYFIGKAYWHWKKWNACLCRRRGEGRALVSGWRTEFPYPKNYDFVIMKHGRVLEH